MVLLQLLSIHDRTVGVTNLGVMLLYALAGRIWATTSRGNLPFRPADEERRRKKFRTHMNGTPVNDDQCICNVHHSVYAALIDVFFVSDN